MVEALGGMDNVLKFPNLENWNGDITINHMTAPVVRGNHGKPFLLFCYLVWNDETGKFNRLPKGEYLSRNKDDSWEGAYGEATQLNLGVGSNHIIKGSLAEKQMLNRIKRLINGEPVGIIQRYTKAGEEVLFVKENIDTPKNAYLKSDELAAFMKEPTNQYERDPVKGSEVFLYYLPSH